MTPFESCFITFTWAFICKIVHAADELASITSTWLEDLTCDEDGHAGQGQPGQVSVGFFASLALDVQHQEAQRGGAVKFGHQVEVNPERCGANCHGNTLINNGKTDKICYDLAVLSGAKERAELIVKPNTTIQFKIKYVKAFFCFFSW